MAFERDELVRKNEADIRRENRVLLGLIILVWVGFFAVMHWLAG